MKKNQHKTEFQELLRDKDEECKSFCHTLHLKESIIDQYKDEILHLQEQNRQILSIDEESDKIKVLLRETERAIQELERELQLSGNNISTLNQSITDVKNQLDRAQRKLTLMRKRKIQSQMKDARKWELDLPNMKKSLKQH